MLNNFFSQLHNHALQARNQLLVAALEYDKNNATALLKKVADAQYRHFGFTAAQGESRFGTPSDLLKYEISGIEQALSSGRVTIDITPDGQQYVARATSHSGRKYESVNGKKATLVTADTDKI